MGIAVAACLSAPMRARAAPVEPLPSPGGASSSPAVGSLIYVTSPAHLAEITRDDSLLHPRAASLDRRARIGLGVTMGGVALGALMIAGAATVFSQTECSNTVLYGPACESGQINANLAVAGLLTAVLVGGVGIALVPSQLEWYDIINAWNSRHPDRTLLVPTYRSGS